MADVTGAEIVSCGDQAEVPDRAAKARSAAEADADVDEASEPGTDDVASGAEEIRVGMPGVAPPPLPGALAVGYPIFSTRFDRVVEADALASPAELDALRAQLDHALIPYGQLVSRLAQRLQRLLLARQSRLWSLDQEAGLIDASRLARFIANPGDERIFRVEAECPFPQTAVTLLIDNSGSMRGHPITVAALTADVLARSLERCDVKVEILGYTTSEVAQADLLDEWQRAGSPAGAGRLNGLQHIVYKAMDSPWHRSRRRLGLMLKDSLLKENIDGEALWWACQRLLRRPESRRLLIVISDGAPMDKNTLAANSRSFLEAHLHQVVGWITRQTDIELRAIGIGFPVARYYPKSISLAKVDELGSVLIGQLGDWLS